VEPERIRAAQRALVAYDARSTGGAVGSLLLTLTYWVVAFAAAAAAPWWPVRIVAGALLGIVAMNLFLVAHDAGHGSYTGRRGLDAVIGRVAFLPVLHPFSLWAEQHNRVHHRWTNLRGRDFVWTPLDQAAYGALSPWRRWWQRAYRTTPGFALYYGREIWLGRLFSSCWPLRAVHRADRALVGAFLAAEVLVALRLGGPGAVLTAIALPFVLTLWMAGFGTYLNHTHPRVPWFTDEAEWSYLEAQLEGSVHLVYPGRAAAFLGNIMEHPAHHLRTRVPLCNLADAQAEVERRVGDAVVTERWSWAAHRRIVRTCRLYDYEAHRWVDFDGTPLTPPLRPAAAAYGRAS
jgi:omega-6 fatty acid desaturase (delta-12 desaturase)